MSEPTLADDLPDHTTATSTDEQDDVGLANGGIIQSTGSVVAGERGCELPPPSLGSPRPAQEPQPGQFCTRHFSWLCQAGQGRCQAGSAAARGWDPDRTQDPAASDDGLTRCCAWPGCASTYRADVGPRERGWIRLRGLTALCPDHTADLSQPATIDRAQGPRCPVHVIPLPGCSGCRPGRLERGTARPAQSAAQPPAHPSEGDREGDTIPKAHRGAETDAITHAASAWRDWYTASLVRMQDPDPAEQALIDALAQARCGRCGVCVECGRDAPFAEQAEACEHGVSLDDECQPCLVDLYGADAVRVEQAEG